MTAPPTTQAPPTPWRFSMEHLWALAVLACIWAFVATHPIRPHDFWWHLEIGRQITQSHVIPVTDSFSYTAPGAPYPSYQVYWLADVLLYAAYAAGGPALSVFSHALLITLTYALVLALCWRLSGSGRLAAACTVVAAATGFENWNLRPQAITFLLATLFLWLIYRRRAQPGSLSPTLLLFPLLMLIWVNCHGSFPLGVALLGFWLLEALSTPGRPLAAPLLALALTAAATLVNPQGLGVYGYLRAMAANEVVQRLPEWAPASLATNDGLAFFAILALSVAALSRRWRRLRLFHLLTLVAFAALAWKTGRAIV